MKKILAILVMLAVLCSSSAFSVGAQGLPFEQILGYEPPSGGGCSKLLYAGNGVLTMQEEDGNLLVAQEIAVVNQNGYHVWGQIPIRSTCNYRIEACGRTIGVGHGDVELILFYRNEQGRYGVPVNVGEVKGSECVSFYWNAQEYGIPEGVGIEWLYDGDGEPTLEYNFKIYEECPCSLPALYPKVDIEQFSVAGGETIIRDGKLLSSFEISPGVQQTFIQVENRGFFTQNDARVKLMGLPQGVTVKITPETQKLKAHNIGTYSAEFTVDSNVPSGTYDVTLVAYSPTGIFDTIQFKFVVP
jgi:hypothetical protein